MMINNDNYAENIDRKNQKENDSKNVLEKFCKNCFGKESRFRKMA